MTADDSEEWLYLKISKRMTEKVSMLFNTTTSNRSCSMEQECLFFLTAKKRRRKIASSWSMWINISSSKLVFSLLSFPLTNSPKMNWSLFLTDRNKNTGGNTTNNKCLKNQQQNNNTSLLSLLAKNYLVFWPLVSSSLILILARA